MMPTAERPAPILVLALLAASLPQPVIARIIMITRSRVASASAWCPPNSEATAM